MQVYVELAVLENFCMDYTLLYAAKTVAKNPASYFRVGFGAAIGACVAVVVPLLNLNAAPSVIVKIISGLLICLSAGKFNGVKSYLRFTGIFLILCAVLGGALVGVFSLAGLDYESGGGYILSSVPVGIPLFCALLLIIGAKRLAVRLTKNSKNAVICRIYAGQSEVELSGFFDSGNKVYYKGEPVSVIPKDAAEKLIDADGIKDGVKIHTVAGSKTLKVFTADRIEIVAGDKTYVLKGARLGISPNRIYRAVLHPDLAEN